jgi:hypothetical protein
MSESMEDVEEDENAEERVKLLQERPHGDDLSCYVTEKLGAAFTLLDKGFPANRLDATDLQFAFYVVNLFPSKKQVTELLVKTCTALARIEGKSFDLSDEDTFADRGEFIHMFTNVILVDLPKTADCPTRGYTLAQLASGGGGGDSGEGNGGSGAGADGDGSGAGADGDGSGARADGDATRSSQLYEQEDQAEPPPADPEPTNVRNMPAKGSEPPAAQSEWMERAMQRKNTIRLDDVHSKTTAELDIMDGVKIII